PEPRPSARLREGDHRPVPCRPEERARGDLHADRVGHRGRDDRCPPAGRCGLPNRRRAPESKQRGPPAGEAHPQAATGRVPVRLAVKQKALMHNKVGIFDAKTVCTGSFNWTNAAQKRNDENLIVIEGAQVAEDYETFVFERILSTETESEPKA